MHGDLKLSAGISYSSWFEQWDACVAVGLGLWDWELGNYPIPFKAAVVAFSRLRREVEMHVEDARYRKMKRSERKRRR